MIKRSEYDAQQIAETDPRRMITSLAEALGYTLSNGEWIRVAKVVVTPKKRAYTKTRHPVAQARVRARMKVLPSEFYQTLRTIGLNEPTDVTDLVRGIVTFDQLRKRLYQFYWNEQQSGRRGRRFSAEREDGRIIVRRTV